MKQRKYDKRGDAMMDDLKKRNFIVKMILLIGLVMIVVLNFDAAIGVMRKINAVISPLIYGAAIAFVLNILVVFYERIYFPRSRNKLVNKSKRGMSILFSLLTIILVVIFFLNIVIPQIVQFVSLLIKGFPDVYDSALKWAIDNSDVIPSLQKKVEGFSMNGEEVLKKSMEILGNWTFGTVSFIGSAFGAVIKFILALTFGIYILADKEELKRRFDRLFKAYIKPSTRKKLYEVMETANDTFSGYIVGQCKEAVILGILCTIGMLILRFPYAKVIGPVIGLTALIPMLGAYIGAVLGFLLIVTIDWFQAVLFLVFIVVLQQLEGNFIYPKVVGSSIGLPGIWVFAAVAVGGGLMGITGILFGVPLVATAYKLLRKAVNKRNEI
ncbi:MULTISPECIES: AI-2E family transporter [unclassified Sedimentibacter]|uniref:AI-2E family transporter n=1 Tax=unclassified Sedimentibacter TaxID=2649220 RepID=UPI0027E1FE77|nr:AI-2E family transporter [Sedimentibacter sp. MB35-C1]WMJ78912.1 AI-2E family transporter [Sedimentibacter sp. MB35-C1]